jgi:hypothetical protein
MKPDALGRKPCPWTSTVQAGHGAREPGLARRPDPIHDLFAMADERQHREHRPDEHPVLPHAALTQFEVGGITLSSMETGVAQDEHAFFKLPNQPLEGGIRRIDGGARPRHH